ncbi:hypothetical protein GPJ56_004532 [Histomonas meleagridis]|uniref:uncharacterized protein n=1 Tax=Histomonas meleagridis TaxID=135588 RepID=UPI00355A5FC2|nr:hypothetical protein GPJ56_004532 [Histomonas meleagridis]KAH0797351.1 hypothetical protein GO595_009854 [Histomonas meleagridis]
MSEEPIPKFPVQFTVSSGEEKPVDFGEHTDFICALFSIKRLETPNSTGKISVKVSYMDVESGAEDVDTADIVQKSYTLIEIEENDYTEKEIEFQCVHESEAVFSVEGNGTVQLDGILIPDIDFTEEEEEEEVAEK